MKSTLKKAIESNGIKVFGEWVMINSVLYPLPLVQGNEKLGHDVWHSSLTATNRTITAIVNGETFQEMGTCPTTCPGCYACTGNYRFNSTKYYLIMRTRLLRNHPDIYFLLVSLQIEHENIKKVRIHAAGDFVPGEAAGWIEVLKAFPNIKAWTYTKVKNAPDIIRLNALPNMNVVKSIIPGCGFNYGHVAYIAATFYKLLNAGKSVYICRCGIDKTHHCSDCNGCSDHEYVLFIEHSTGYKAEADYGFKKLADLIDSQG